MQKGAILDYWQGSTYASNILLSQIGCLHKSQEKKTLVSASVKKNNGQIWMKKKLLTLQTANLTWFVNTVQMEKKSKK